MENSRFTDAGREQYFEKLYRQAFPKVAALVQRRGGNLAEAKDVFHDALIAFYEKKVAGELQIKTEEETYITGIARHMWYRRCREAARVLPLDTADREVRIFPKAAPDPSRRLLTFLERAGRRCMDLLQAFYYHGFSMREIANEFGYSGERSATVQKYKCLEKVREQVHRKTSGKEMLPA